MKSVLQHGGLAFLEGGINDATRYPGSRGVRCFTVDLIG